MTHRADCGRSPRIANALCRGLDPNLFFPAKGELEDVKAAKSICAACPARAECLEAFLYDPHFTHVGIVGGTSYIERQQIRSARARGAG